MNPKWHTMNLKQKRIISPKWTQAAQGQPCTFNLPDICSYDSETTVFCHAPSSGKGMAIKSDDIWGADGCYTCHSMMDDMNQFTRIGWTDNDWQYFWLRAIHETLRNRYERGIKW